MVITSIQTTRNVASQISMLVTVAVVSRVSCRVQYIAFLMYAFSVISDEQERKVGKREITVNQNFIFIIN